MTRARVTVRHGNAPVQSAILERRQFIRIGRDPGNDLRLDSPEVAPFHAEISWDGRTAGVTDRNAEGSGFKTIVNGFELSPNFVEQWDGKGSIQVGPFTLTLQAEAEPQAQRGGAIAMKLASKQLTITPGQPATCGLTLQNSGQIVLHAGVTVSGVPGQWVKCPERVQLNPGEQKNVTLTVDVPKNPTSRAGPHGVEICAESAEQPRVRATENAEWTILPFEAVSALPVTPQVARAVRSARYQVIVRNEGNAPVVCELSSSDQQQVLTHSFRAAGAPPAVKLSRKIDAGGELAAILEVAGRKRWFGSAVKHQVAIGAAVNRTTSLNIAPVEFVQRPLLPSWLLGLLLAALLPLGLLLSYVLTPGKPTITVKQDGVEVPEGRVKPRARVEVFLTSGKASGFEVHSDPAPEPSADGAPGQYVFPKGLSRATTVRARATRWSFESGWAERTIELVPIVIDFKATPDKIVKGQRATLAWKVENAESVRIEPGFSGPLELAGQRDVAPEEDTDYALFAKRPGEEAAHRVKIAVAPLPAPIIIDFRVSPSRVMKGGRATLSWEVGNATSVSIERANLQNDPRAKGAILVGPAATTEYTLVARGPGGTERATAIVEVDLPPPPLPPTLRSFVAEPPRIFQGDTAVLRWWVDNTNSVVVAGETRLPKGELRVSPSSTTRYTLMAQGQTLADVTVEVVPPKPSPVVIREFSVDRQAITQGESVVLSWKVDNAGSVEIQGLGRRGPVGQEPVAPPTTTTYTLVAEGPGGIQSRSLQVRVEVPQPKPDGGGGPLLPLPDGDKKPPLDGPKPPPIVQYFRPNPPTITRGGEAVLQWRVVNAQSVRIEPGVGSQPIEGTVRVRPAGTLDYELIAEGPGGRRTQRVTVTVTTSPQPGPIVIQYFRADPPRIARGGQAVLSWRVDNASRVRIDPGMASLQAAGTVVVRPTVTTPYTLVAEGQGGTRTQRVTVEVTLPACEQAVQGKIPWNQQGNRNWPPDMVARLCAKAENSHEPASCFHQIMPRFGSGVALDLCEGTRDANRRIVCFNSVFNQTRSAPKALQTCQNQ